MDRRQRRSHPSPPPRTTLLPSPPRRPAQICHPRRPCLPSHRQPQRLAVARRPSRHRLHLTQLRPRRLSALPLPTPRSRIRVDPNPRPSSPLRCHASRRLSLRSTSRRPRPPEAITDRLLRLHHPPTMVAHHVLLLLPRRPLNLALSPRLVLA